jgi:tetratricopeptide (TPR) repeat protein
VAWKRPAHELTAVVRAGDGREVLRYSPAAPAATPPEVPPPATEPPLPAAIASSDELYLTGLHLEQYRHATRRPEDYWREALRRDPADSRSNHALGRWHLQLGEFAQAERFLNSAIASLTRRNPNPRDGEAYFDLGVTLRYLDRWDEAYAAFYRAAWNFAWQAASYHALAEIDVARGQWHTALDHLDRALRRDADHLKARNLKAVALRALGREREAEEWIRETLALDPLDSWARHLAGQGWPGHNQDRLDLAFDYARAGLCDTALEALAGADPDSGDGSAPMVLYTQAWLELRRGGARLAAHRYARRAQAADPRYCFPNRLEEIAVLRAAVEFSPGDARARYYLGNLFYDRRRHGEAIALWEESARLDPSYSVVWRNLGIAYFNVSRHSLKARVAFDRAVAAAAPGDARVVYERDQLWKRLGIAPLRRLAELKRQAAAVAARDDLAIEVAALYNLLGQPDQARTLLESRQFQPWEGGEGKALGEYARACVALGRGALEAGDPAEARRFLEAALQPPRSLGETWHLLARPLEIYYWMGEAFAAAGNRRDARRWWTLAAETRSATFDPNTHYRALSLRALGKESAAVRLWRDLRGHAAALLRTEPKIDYFATSLPAMLLFEEDLTRRDAITAHLLAAQAALGLGDKRAWQRHTRELRKLDPHHPEAEPKY